MCVSLRRRVDFGRVLIVRNNFSYLLTNGHLRSVRGQGTQLAEMFAQNWPTHQGRLCSFDFSTCRRQRFFSGIEEFFVKLFTRPQSCECDFDLIFRFS